MGLQAQDTVVSNNAISKLAAASSSANILELAQQHADGSVPKVVNISNVTEDFLRVERFEGPLCMQSTYFVYRGLIQALAGRMPKHGHLHAFGILAGVENMVHDCILADDLEGAMASQELAKRWSESGCELMGLVAWDHDGVPRNYLDQLALLFSKRPDVPLLLLIFGDSAEPNSWEFNNGEFVAVELGNKQKNRRKGVSFHVIAIEQVGVSFADEAQQQVAQAIHQHLERKANTVTAKHASSQPGVCLQKFPIPPDGLCFWRSIIASLQPEAYKRVLRHPSGFAVNPRVERHESQTARSLMALAAGGSSNQDEMFRGGYVDISQIAGIGELLNLAIRVTMSDEALISPYILSALNHISFELTSHSIMALWNV